LRRAAGLGWFLTLLPLVPIVFYAKYSYWEGGYCWGPRYLVPSLAFWVLPLAFISWSSRVARRLVLPAITVAAAFQMLGVSVSFLECQVDRGYYSDGFRYDLGYSAASETLDVLGHYVAESVGGRFLTEPEGLGFDRWFFFLRKAGLSSAGLGSVILACVAMLSVTLILLVQAIRRLRDEEETSPLTREASHPITTHA